jgi:hypothetical protein
MPDAEERADENEYMSKHRIGQIHLGRARSSMRCGVWPACVKPKLFSLRYSVPIRVPADHTPRPLTDRTRALCAICIHEHVETPQPVLMEQACAPAVRLACGAL